MLNTRFSTALHTLLALLLDRDGAPLSSQALARVFDSNPVVVRRLVADLRAAGLVVSVRGAGGGIQPSKGLREVTLGAVARAVDFEPAFDVHEAAADAPPPSEHIHAAVAAARDSAHAALLAHLDQVTLGDMADSANLRTELAALIDKGLSHDDIRQAYRVAGAHLVPKVDR